MSKHYSCADRMCGADDCANCHGENFDAEGQYMDEDYEERKKASMEEAYKERNKIASITLLHVDDVLKAGQWASWECEVTYNDGTIKSGFIQADYHDNYEISTLEVEQ